MEFLKRVGVSCLVAGLFTEVGIDLYGFVLSLKVGEMCRMVQPVEAQITLLALGFVALGLVILVIWRVWRFAKDLELSLNNPGWRPRR